MKRTLTLLPLLILLLLTSCGGVEGAGNGTPGSTPVQNTVPLPTHDLSVAPSEEEIEERLNQGYREIYWTISDDFVPEPGKNVTVYNTVPLEDENTDLEHDEIIWNTLFPDLTFDNAVHVVENRSLNFDATIDGTAAFGIITPGDVYIYFPLHERPDSLAPELLLDKLEGLTGIALRIDENDRDNDMLYRGILDGIPVDGKGYATLDGLNVGPVLTYHSTTKFDCMSIILQFKLGSPAGVIPTESMIPIELVKKIASAHFAQSLGDGIVVLDRAEFCYYVTPENQLRPGYYIDGSYYFLIHDDPEFGIKRGLCRQQSYVLIDAETGEMVYV